MSFKPNVYFTSNVFTSEEIGSNEKIDINIREAIKSLWFELGTIAKVKVFGGRFPNQQKIKHDIENFDPYILGCHISQPISSELIKDSNIFAISTSTAGYNHISPSLFNDILITHTPGVLHETVADYTISLIMANLRNLIDLHNYVWRGEWSKEKRWDLDQDLSSILPSKTLGIVGLGEIGIEIVKKLSFWNVKIIYYDINRKSQIENMYPNIAFRPNLEDIFREADVVSLHVPLNKNTEKLVNKDLLKLMKSNSLLINTARGNVLDLDDLLNLLEKEQVKIHFVLDVFPEEPINKITLKRIKKLKNRQPDLRIILMPHNASADANTRGKMVRLFLEDIIKLIKSSSIDDLKEINIIPEQKISLTKNNWIIRNYWQRKLKVD
jgi:glyoxylate reductase